MPTANSHLVVIGGTSGLGLEIAKAAHASGIKVTIGGRGAERAAETAKSIGPDVTAVHIDLGDLASIRPALRESNGMVRQVREAHLSAQPRAGSPPWACSSFRPLALICSMPLSSSVWTAGTWSRSTSQQT